MTWREKRKGRREREGEREGKKGRESNFVTYDPLQCYFITMPIGGIGIVWYTNYTYMLHVQDSACSILVTEVKGTKLWHK